MTALLEASHLQMGVKEWPNPVPLGENVLSTPILWDRNPAGLHMLNSLAELFHAHSMLPLLRLTCVASVVHMHYKSKDFTALLLFCVSFLSFFLFCSFVHLFVPCPPQHSSPIFRITIQSSGTFPPQGGWTSLHCAQYCSMFTWDCILNESLCFSGLLLCTPQLLLLRNYHSTNSFFITCPMVTLPYCIHAVDVLHYHNFCCLSILHLIAFFCSILPFG